MQVLVLLVSFFACTVGAICGIGGGIIIKPVLDATGVADVATINFLSGCTVLSMTLYSVLKAKLSGTSTIDPKTDTPLAIGAAVGGLAGKELFSLVAGLSPTPTPPVPSRRGSFCSSRWGRSSIPSTRRRSPR